MKMPRPFMWTLSAVLTIVLIVLLVKVSKLNLQVTMQQLRAVSWMSFTILVLLTAAHIYLSSLKWRCVDARLRSSGDAAPSRNMSFTLTSLGVALGQLLPVQISMSLTRTLGTYFNGKALRRGTGGTLFEQAFDVIIVGFLSIASGVTLLCKGGALLWMVLATVMAAIAMLAVGPVVRLIRSQVDALNARAVVPSNRVLRSIASLHNSGLLDAGLGRQLMALSTARLTIQVLMAGQSARAIGVHIPLWRLAAAMPFVIIACVIVVTPAGLGVNELSYATTLHMFGTPLHTGAQWALANRFLVASSCFVVALCATATLGLAKRGRMATREPVERAVSRCTVCGGDQWSFVRRGCDLYQPNDKETFALDRCLKCGQIMQNPLPSAEQLNRGYSAQYAPYRPGWKEAGRPLWKILRDLTTARRLRRLERYGSGGRLLEVGCGAGDFLYAAKRAGWDVKAVEYSDVLAEALRSELGFDVRAGDLVPGLWEPHSFDAVVMWSVLEHLQNPLQALATASSYLKPGGVLFIQIPTLYGVQRGMRFRQYWALLDLPRHLGFFGKTLLGDLCDRAGMQLTVFKTPVLETVWCYFASVSNYAKLAGSPLRRLLGAGSLALMAVLVFPLEAVHSWRGRGTEAFAVAVKR